MEEEEEEEEESGSAPPDACLVNPEHMVAPSAGQHSSSLLLRGYGRAHTFNKSPNTTTRERVDFSRQRRTME